MGDNAMKTLSKRCLHRLSSQQSLIDLVSLTKMSLPDHQWRFYWSPRNLAGLKRPKISRSFPKLPVSRFFSTSPSPKIGFLGWYLSKLESRPLLTKSITTSLIFAAADFTSQVHLDYLDAGANRIITASYQATIQGFEAKGFSKGESESLLRKSVEITCEEHEIYRDRYTKESWDIMEHDNTSRRPVLVAAPVGSFGAYLADGSDSEYSGNYRDLVSLQVKDFHRRNVQFQISIALSQ